MKHTVLYLETRIAKLQGNGKDNSSIVRKLLRELKSIKKHKSLEN